MVMLIAFIVTLLVIYSFTYKYLKEEKYLKYTSYTFGISLPISFALILLVKYIQAS